MASKLIQSIKNLGKGPSLKSRSYDLAVDYTLRFYERWILPQPWHHSTAKDRISLRELKLKEFRERRKLLNPY
jgi:hypothetical protein